MPTKNLFLCVKLSAKRYKSSVSLYGSDFVIVGIHTNEPPYKLSWCLNDTFMWDFVCEKVPFAVNLPEKLVSMHAEFHYQGSELNPRLWLLQNQGSELRLVNQKPIPDYFLIVEKEFAELRNWEEMMRNVNGVQHAYTYPEKIAQKMHWVYNLKHLIKE